MRSGRGGNDSQKISNLYSLATIIIMSVVMVIYSKYLSPKNEKNPNFTKEPLACQKIDYSYDKVFNRELLEKSYKLYENGYIDIKGGIIKAEYMKSNFNDINLSEIDNFYIQTINKNIDNNVSGFLTIKYELIENDKADPNKKSDECKLNCGSILSSFRFNGVEAYRIYMDFKDLNMNQIKSKINCSIKAYENNAKL